MLAVFSALKEEINSFALDTPLKGFSGSRAWKGIFGCPENLLVLTGVGKEKARSAVIRVLEQYSIDLIVSTGFAGALNAGSQPGEIVVCHSLFYGKRDCDTGSQFPVVKCDAQLVELALKCAEGSGLKAVCGRCLTLDEVCATVAGKHAAALKFKSDVVDMESYWIGQIAAERQIPFLAVRAIFDEAADDLTVLELISSAEKRAPVKAVRYLLVHPGSIGDISRFYRKYRQAARSLAVFFQALVPRLGERVNSI